MWLWEKQRFVDQIGPFKEEQVPLQASFNPEDPTCILVTGKDVYRYLKLSEHQLKA